MNKLSITVCFTILFVQCAIAQVSMTKTLNLDFEQHQNGFPSQWVASGDDAYKIYLDSLYRKSGRFAAVIENTDGKKGYKALSITLPNNYEGKFIRLSGFIKTENVTEGYAGLWMRIDPELGFDNMSNRGITGTRDWAAFEIILPLKPSETDKIVVGGMLVGKGKMWLDKLKISIDGMQLDDPKLKHHQKEISPAQADRAFDKGSAITFPVVNQRLIDNLDVLGRIWGLMKYHHPEIAKGKYNWDYELLRILPEYLQVKDKQQRDQVLTNWIKKYGTPAPCKNCKTSPAD